MLTAHEKRLAERLPIGGIFSAALLAGAAITQPAVAHEHQVRQDDSHDGGQEHREHRSHLHGAASLTIAMEDDEMEIELDSPAMNLLGFEHAAATAEEKAKFAEVEKQLQDPAVLVDLSGGGCKVASADVNMPDTGKAGHDEEGSQHFDIEAAYKLTCSQPKALKQLTIIAFENFPGFSKMSVHWVLDSGQGSREVTAEAPLLNLN